MKNRIESPKVVSRVESKDVSTSSPFHDGPIGSDPNKNRRLTHLERQLWEMRHGNYIPYRSAGNGMCQRLK